MKTTKKSALVNGVCVLTFFGTMGGVSGAMLFGQIGMMGKATLDEAMGTATSITEFGKARVGYGTGDYGVPGAANKPVVYTPLAFWTPLSEPMVIWQFNAGGSVYSFELQKWDYDRFELNGDSFMNLSGTGFAYLNGGRQTPADFVFSSQQCMDSTELVVTWSAETIVRGVPEGGTSLSLLLLGLVGIEVLRKRMYTSVTA